MWAAGGAGGDGANFEVRDCLDRSSLGSDASSMATSMSPAATSRRSCQYRRPPRRFRDHGEEEDVIVPGAPSSSLSRMARADHLGSSLRSYSSRKLSALGSRGKRSVVGAMKAPLKGVMKSPLKGAVKKVARIARGKDKRGKDGKGKKDRALRPDHPPRSSYVTPETQRGETSTPLDSLGKLKDAVVEGAKGGCGGLLAISSMDDVDGGTMELCARSVTEVFSDDRPGVARPSPASGSPPRPPRGYAAAPPLPDEETEDARDDAATSGPGPAAAAFVGMFPPADVCFSLRGVLSSSPSSDKEPATLPLPSGIGSAFVAYGRCDPGVSLLPDPGEDRLVDGAGLGGGCLVPSPSVEVSLDSSVEDRYADEVGLDGVCPVTSLSVEVSADGSVEVMPTPRGSPGPARLSAEASKRERALGEEEEYRANFQADSLSPTLETGCEVDNRARFERAMNRALSRRVQGTSTPEKFYKSYLKYQVKAFRYEKGKEVDGGATAKETMRQGEEAGGPSRGPADDLTELMREACKTDSPGVLSLEKSPLEKADDVDAVDGPGMPSASPEGVSQPSDDELLPSRESLAPGDDCREGEAQPANNLPPSRHSPAAGLGGITGDDCGTPLVCLQGEARWTDLEGPAHIVSSIATPHTPADGLGKGAEDDCGILSISPEGEAHLANDDMPPSPESHSPATNLVEDTVDNCSIPSVSPQVEGRPMGNEWSLEGADDDCSIPSLFPEGEAQITHDNRLHDVVATPPAPTVGGKDAADSVLAWTALAAVMGSPAPSSAKRSSSGRGLSNLWEEAEGSGPLPEIDEEPEVDIVCDEVKAHDCISVVSIDLDELCGDEVNAGVQVSRAGPEKDGADSVLAWGVLGMILGAPAPSPVKKCASKPRLNLWEDVQESDVLPEIEEDELPGDIKESNALPALGNCHERGEINLDELGDVDEDEAAEGREEGAEAVLAWGALGMILGSPAPKSVVRTLSRSSVKLFEEGEENDKLPEIEGDSSGDIVCLSAHDLPCIALPKIEEEKKDDTDSYGMCELDLKELGDTNADPKSEGQQNGGKQGADSVLAWSALGMIMGSPAPKQMSKRTKRRLSQHLFDDGCEATAHELEGLIPSPGDNNIARKALGEENESLAHGDRGTPSLSRTYDEEDDVNSIPSLSGTSGESEDPSNRDSISPVDSCVDLIASPKEENKKNVTDSVLAWGAFAAIMGLPAPRVTMPARRRKETRDLWAEEGVVDHIGLGYEDPPCIESFPSQVS